MLPRLNGSAVGRTSSLEEDCHHKIKYLLDIDAPLRGVRKLLVLPRPNASAAGRTSSFEEDCHKKIKYPRDNVRSSSRNKEASRAPTARWFCRRTDFLHGRGLSSYKNIFWTIHFLFEVRRKPLVLPRPNGSAAGRTSFLEEDYHHIKQLLDIETPLRGIRKSLMLPRPNGSTAGRTSSLEEGKKLKKNKNC